MAQLNTREWLILTLTPVEPLVPAIEMPVEPMFLTTVLFTSRVPPPDRLSKIPLAVPPKSPSIMQSSMKTFVLAAAPLMLTPISPESNPLKFKLRSRTDFLTSPTAVKLSNGMLMPFVPALRIEAKTSWQSMVIDLVIVTAPKPPGSRQLISPLTAVLEIAPAKVLQGAVRLHGLASSPTPDTQVRDACACAMEANANIEITIARAVIVSRNLFIWSLLFLLKVRGWAPVERGAVPATVAPSLPTVDAEWLFINPPLINSCNAENL